MIIEILLVAGMATTPPQPPDPFFGEDKIKHFVTSFVVGSISMSGARAAGLNRSDAILAGAGFTVAIGVAKEINDSRRGQFFSVRDLLWDIAGTGAGAALLSQTR